MGRDNRIKNGKAKSIIGQMEEFLNNKNLLNLVLKITVQLSRLPLKHLLVLEQELMQLDWMQMEML